MIPAKIEMIVSGFVVEGDGGFIRVGLNVQGEARAVPAAAKSRSDYFTVHLASTEVIICRSAFSG